MDVKLTGTVKQVLEEQTGEGRNGPWRKQEFILETEGDYPKEVCIVQWGEKIEELGVKEGERLTVHVDIQSREYGGRWYTDVKAWRVERQAGAAPSGPPPAEEPFPAPSDPGALDDDLPF
ncbi:MAG: DUF3127 domain-containing protein [Candidatus Palauibacterales bacterium]|nr:DUF3127 domain-containing protein [Candidatus Palauibacterales bacterium]